jgi:hypothetical protein
MSTEAERYAFQDGAPHEGGARERTLVAALVSGPTVQPSFQAIYAEHVHFVWRSLRLLGVSLESLEDAVQDTFAVVAQKLPTFEGRSLERIERALRNADAPLALALLAELDERYPKTRLVEERQAARLMAHCVAGEPDAKLAAERFLQAQPSSVYAARLRALCFMP